MREYLPLLIVCAVIGVFTILFLAAYAVLKRKTKEETSERHMSDSEIIRRLLGYARPYKKDFVLVFLIMLVSIAYDVVSPLLVADIQGTIKQSFELSRLYSLVAVYAGILAVSMVCTYFQAMILQKTGQKILSQIRLDTFTHIEQLSHAQLNQIPVGKLVTRVTNDPNSISYLFTNILVTLAKNSLVIIGVLAAMLILNYALTLMVLCFVPFLVLFTIIFQKFSRHVHRTVNNARTDVNTYLSENLSGMKVTQIFNQEQRKMDEFLARSKRLEKTKMNRMFVFGIFRPMVYMLFVTSNLFLFYIGCKGYIKDTTFLGQTITSETVVAFYMYISRFFNPIQALAEQFDMLEQSFAAAEKIFTILDMVPEVVDEPDAIELKEMKGEIEFRDVWFAYNPGEWVLKGVSFHVYPKQTVAFVGATGSGKSTILSLICRKYKIPLYLDGARLGYALASHENNVTLSDIARLTDVFYIGGTKVGALCGEALVFTKHNTPPHFVTQIKQHGALIAKGRLLGIQFAELFRDNLYYKLGQNAIETAEMLKMILHEKKYSFYFESPTNQQFVIVDNRRMEALRYSVTCRNTTIPTRSSVSAPAGRRSRNRFSGWRNYCKSLIIVNNRRNL